jgi:hypothetical protein
MGYHPSALVFYNGPPDCGPFSFHPEGGRPPAADTGFHRGKIRLQAQRLHSVLDDAALMWLTQRKSLNRTYPRGQVKNQSAGGADEIEKKGLFHAAAERKILADYGAFGHRLDAGF